MVTPFFKYNGIKIFNQDFLECNIPDKSIDFIFTSPPYNLDIKYDKYDDCVSWETYWDFAEKWLKKCFKLLKDDGRLMLNTFLLLTSKYVDKKINNHKEYKVEPVGINYLNIAQKIGYKVMTNFVWVKHVPRHKTSWGSFKSPSCPHIHITTENLWLFYKKHRKKQQKGISTISKEDFMKYTKHDWHIKPNPSDSKNHPAPFPIELPEKAIHLFTWKDDIILDPFMGSGTTLLAAIKTERKAIGFDISKEYCNVAKKRILDFATQINAKKLFGV